MKISIQYCQMKDFKNIKLQNFHEIYLLFSKSYKDFSYYSEKVLKIIFKYYFKKYLFIC